MLVLSRKNKETVVLSAGGVLDRVMRVTVLDITKGKVKLGFEVDAEVAVHRLEVWDRMAARGELKRPEPDSGTSVELS